MLFKCLENNKTVKKNKILQYIQNYCNTYNISIIIFISNFITFHIYNKTYSMNSEWLDLFQLIIHYKKFDENIILLYFIEKMIYLYKSL